MEPQKSEAGEEQQGDGVAAADVVGVAAGAADAALVGAVDAVGAVAAKGGAKDPACWAVCELPRTVAQGPANMAAWEEEMAVCVLPQVG